MGSDIRFKRGNKADLPTSAPSGTPLWCEDSKELYIGTNNSVSRVGLDEDTMNAAINAAKSELTNTINTGLSNKVSKSGDTMTGDLGISKVTPAITLNNTNTVSSYASINIKSEFYDYSTSVAPESNYNLGRLRFLDKNGNQAGGLSCLHNTSNNLYAAFGVSRLVNSVSVSSYVSAYVNSAGEAYATAPTWGTYTDSSTKIATTAFVKGVLNSSGNGLSTFKKAANGYIKFANGILIQWMKVTQSANSVTHTWPTSFSSATSYATSPSQLKGGGSDQNLAVTAQTATKVTIYAEDGERSKGLYLIGVGY